MKVEKPKSEIRKIIPDGTGKLAGLTLLSIGINYFVPQVLIRDLWFIALMIVYFRSRDEAFWLAFMLILNDGFAGFFGIRGVQISSLPIPEFELTHIYLMAVIIKVIRTRSKTFVFYDTWLKVLGLYILFLIYIGFSMGMPEEYSIVLRTVRSTFPLLLFYFLPRLINKQSEYERFFGFVFLLVISAFITQMFSIVTGFSPPALFGVGQAYEVEDLTKETWRGLFNIAANITGFFAALFYLASRKDIFNRTYLQLVLIAIYGTAFFSATRGWIMGLGISLMLFFVFIQKVSIRKVAGFGIIAFIALQIIILHPRIRLQMGNSIMRTLTLRSVFEGDLTAGGTSSRADIQAPKVMKVWAQKPVFGWGFSDTYFQNYNIHVGNQTILLHSGIVGAILLIFFFIYFFRKLYLLALKPGPYNYFKMSLLIFPVTFAGWFFIHSSSGQQFGYTTSYIYALPQAVFLSFGAILYKDIANRPCNKPSVINKIKTPLKGGVSTEPRNIIV